MKRNDNILYITFPAIPENERISRTIAAAFLADMNPTVEELDDVKTAVSEAVTNCIIHAYESEERKNCFIEMECRKEGQMLSVSITDKGKGIEDVELAMEPLYTTKADEERCGMGFSFMEAFMDYLHVLSEAGKGTKVIMKKKIGPLEKM